MSEIVLELPPGLHAEQERVRDAARLQRRRDVGLVENVGAIVRMIVGGQRQRPGGAHRAVRIHVAVELVVASGKKVVPQMKAPVQTALDRGRERVHRRCGAVLFQRSEELRRRDDGRPVLL